MREKRIWIRFTSWWTGQERILSFDTEKEALHFMTQVKSPEILPWGDGMRLIKEKGGKM